MHVEYEKKQQQQNKTDVQEKTNTKRREKKYCMKENLYTHFE